MSSPFDVYIEVWVEFVTRLDKYYAKNKDIRIQRLFYNDCSYYHVNALIRFWYRQDSNPNPLLDYKILELTYYVKILILKLIFIIKLRY